MTKLIDKFTGKVAVGDIVAISYPPENETEYYLVVELNGLENNYCLIEVGDLVGFMPNGMSEKDNADSKGYYKSLKDLEDYLKTYDRCRVYHNFDIVLPQAN